MFFTHFLDEDIQKKAITEEGNCLIIKSDALAGINCFFSNLGFICENRGTPSINIYIFFQASEIFTYPGECTQFVMLHIFQKSITSTVEFKI